MHPLTRAVLGALLCVGLVLLSVANSAATAAPSDLDETWGQSGVVMLDGAWLADGKLQFGRDLVVAYVKDASPWTLDEAAQIVRLDTGGRLDATFGAGGALQPTCSPGCTTGGAFDVMPDGRVVARGDKGFADYGRCQDVGIDRFLPDGRPDPWYGTAGRVSLGLAYCREGQFVASPSGEAFYPAVSWSPAHSSVNSGIYYVDANGAHTGSFSGGTHYDDGTVGWWSYSGALVADYKRRVWAATFPLPNQWVAIVRFLDRQPDSTFGVDGRAVASVPGVVGMDRIALDTLGGVIATGIAEVGGRRQLFLVRFTDRGIVDTGFGVAGVAYVALAAAGEEVAGIRVAVQLDGRIVVAATVQDVTSSTNKYPRIAVVRLLPDGTPDLRFAGGGVANLWTHWGTAVQFVAVRPTGEVIVGGNSITAYQDGDAAYVPVVFQLRGGDLATPRPLRERRAIEYFHAAYGHYFMTADADEIASLDMSGETTGWQRTRSSFNVWDVASADVVPVCRFWSDQSFAPKSSHFYTPYADECAAVKENRDWLFERNAFFVRMPQGALGSRTCPAGMQTLYRAYNNFMGGAPNHRYMTDPAALDAMIAQGWIMEGEAATRVFACVPQQD